eukprot:CAMPEP_0182568238 /NCGR_PEP_ID=MMETSP1324-20130603/9243_1 /TAXON_ID=236786 /ORGANISM="Florenciella sp., Strain RCC1587" /LENGTH=222 /DNA_ID=CAMNT_0024782365 /DNA_START=579 /DNA_END=1245 /DNA_ORIENTATION=-
MPEGLEPSRKVVLALRLALRLAGRRRACPHAPNIVELAAELQLVLVSHFLNQRVDVLLRRRARRRRIHRVTNRVGDDLHVLELLLERGHSCRDLLDIHRLQRLPHSLNHALHALRNLLRLDRGFQSGGDSVDSAAESQVVKLLVLFAYSILGVDPGTLRVPLAIAFLTFDRASFSFLTLFLEALVICLEVILRLINSSSMLGLFPMPQSSSQREALSKVKKA